SQFSIEPTSLTFTGNTVPAGNTQGQFYTFQPNNNGGAMYADNACSTPITQGEGADQLGGFDGTIHSTTNGITYYGGKIRTVYYGTPCAANSPSFGFHTGTSAGLGDGADIDLSAAANQKLKFTYVSDQAISVQLQLFDGAYNPKLNPVTINLIGDNSAHTEEIDFSGYIADDADLTNVRQVSFIYTSETLSPGFGISLTNIQLGSAVISGKASSFVSSSVLFPNPATETANIELSLVKVSDVKVTLTDLMGREVQVISETRGTEVKESFNVANLQKGLYTVNYFVDGAPAKAELLMVK
ncbi:MAG TPA: T9SS type A sorting domain-containing protein, partial [Cytophagaceae bacterium]